jgi:hypothetical protein
MKIKSTLNPGIGTGNGMFNQIGFEFAWCTGAGAGTDAALFAMGGGTYGYPGPSFNLYTPAVTATPMGTATSGANKGSVTLGAVSSVWSNGAARYRPGMFSLNDTPGASGDDKSQALQLQFHDRAWGTDEGSRAFYPITAFYITDAGTAFFGYKGTRTGGTDTGVVVDPSHTTAIRNVAWPDISGGNVVVAPSGTVPTTSTGPGTPGTVMQDATHIYICYAPNQWARVTRDSGW